MPTIDVPLPADLQEFLAKPKCIPLPKPGKVEIHLPTGGTLKGIADITKAIPDDCTLIFSLALQLGPFLANIDCLMKLLKLIKPLIDIIKAIPSVPDVSKIVEAMPAFVVAAKDVTDCILQITGLGIPLFVRDLLCLIIKLLSCIVDQLKSILAVMGGLALQINSAQANGNAELLAALQCAQDDAQMSAQHMMSSIDPVMFLLSLAEPFLGMAGVDPIKTPALASPDDLASMQSTITTLEELVKTLQLVADGIGGCPA
jgi:hypothetical protein